MNQLNFKTFGFLFLITTVFYACKTENKSTKSNEIAKDTITTASGLKYFYITKGKGRKVEPGSKVTAMLSLKVNDSVIWTSYQSKDSVFSHIAGRGGVIKGYNEMELLLREGDDVAAFLPGSIAYGEKGLGKVIPPNATLEYNQFKIVHVGEPKLILADTLFHALKDHGIKKMKSVYKQISKTKDSVLYYRGMDQLNSLWSKLRKESLFKESYDAFTYFNKGLNDINFQFYIMRSLEEQGKLKEAIAKINGVLKTKLTPEQKEYFIKYKQDLVNKSKK